LVDNGISINAQLIAERSAHRATALPGDQFSGQEPGVPERVIAVIPARFASQRFPGKPLALIAGRAMILHVVERVRRARSVSRVIVATDDARILDAVILAGTEAVMTSSGHSSGTERLAEVAEREIAPLYLNVQGDEPLIEPATVDAAIDVIRNNPLVQVGTLAVAVRNPEEIRNPNIVKVVLDADGNALYFSRAPIPYDHGDGSCAALPGAVPSAPVSRSHVGRKHLGIYVYRREALLQFPKLLPGPLECLEQLEQLRFLENGFKIKVGEAAHDSMSVDVPADIAKVEKILAAGRGSAGF
jgi:3-deoxy-manno-octulosonate cytidylyltransferase (CMP-KDO synthetase)